MRPLAALAAFSVACPAALAGQVHVVDDDGGPGVAFTDLQPAVDAAADGDVLLVKTGVYGSFQLVGKGLTILADAESHVVVQGPIEVTGVPAGSLAVLRGLSNAAPVESGISIAACAGPVRVEECSLQGWNTPSDILIAHLVGHGAHVVDSSDVWLVRSTFAGGQGANVGFFGQPYPGGCGVYAEGSSVALVDCVLLGGHGASGPFDDWYSGAPGMHGVAAWDSRLWVGGCSGSGGHGGSGYSDFDPLFGTKMCGDGGDGGSGVALLAYSLDWSAGPAPSEAVVRDLAFTPGGGGDSECAQPGTPGVAVLAVQPPQPVPHSVLELPGPARSTYASSPVRGGANARVHAQGQPGDFFLVLVGDATPPLALPGQPLPLGVGAPALVLGLGVVQASGALQKVFPTPVPAVGSGGATLHLQGVLLPAGGSALELAPLGSLTLLEPAF